MGSNFAKAVAGAVVETRHQWQDFRVALESVYGAQKASLMACALTHDDPSNDCRPQGLALPGGEVGGTERTVVTLALCVLIGILGVGILLRWVRRRRHLHPPRSSGQAGGTTSVAG